MEMRTWATKLVVEPSPTSPIREWLQDKLEQCGFDGNLTSRCVLSIIDRNQCSSPGYRIGLCPMEPVFDCDMEGRSLSSIAVHNSTSLSGRRPNCLVDSCVDYGQVTEVMEVLRLMLSREEWEMHTETIQYVVNELFDKVKQQRITSAVDESDSNLPSASQSPSSDLESRSSQDQAARYYEAFPSLSTQCDLIASANSSFDAEWSRLAQKQPKSCDSHKSDEECHLIPAVNLQSLKDHNVTGDDGESRFGNQLAHGCSSFRRGHGRSRRDRNRQSRYAYDHSRRKNRDACGTNWPMAYRSTHYALWSSDGYQIRMGAFNPYEQQLVRWNRRNVVDEEPDSAVSYKDRFADLECHCWNKPSHQLDSGALIGKSPSKFEPARVVGDMQNSKNPEKSESISTQPATACSPELSRKLSSSLTSTHVVEVSNVQDPFENDVFLGCRPHDPDLWPYLKSERMCLTGCKTGYRDENYKMVDDQTIEGSSRMVSESLLVENVVQTCGIQNRFSCEDVPCRSLASTIKEANRLHCALSKLMPSSSSQNSSQSTETLPQDEAWSGVEIALAMYDDSRSVQEPFNYDAVRQIWQPLNVCEADKSSVKNLECDCSQNELGQELGGFSSLAAQKSSALVPCPDIMLQALNSCDQADICGLLNVGAVENKFEQSKLKFEGEKELADVSRFSEDKTGAMWMLGNESLNKLETLGNYKVQSLTWDSCIYGYSPTEGVDGQKSEVDVLLVPDDQLTMLWNSVSLVADSIEQDAVSDCSDSCLRSSTPVSELLKSTSSEIGSSLCSLATEKANVVYLPDNGDCRLTNQLASIEKSLESNNGHSIESGWSSMRCSRKTSDTRTVEVGEMFSNITDVTGFEELSRVVTLAQSSSPIEPAVGACESCDVVGIVSDVIAGNCESACETARFSENEALIPFSERCASDQRRWSVWECRKPLDVVSVSQENDIMNLYSRETNSSSRLELACFLDGVVVSSPVPISSSSAVDAALYRKSSSSSSVSDIVFSDSDSISSSSNYTTSTSMSSDNSSVFYSSDSAEAVQLPNTPSAIDNVNDNFLPSCGAEGRVGSMLWQFKEESCPTFDGTVSDYFKHSHNITGGCCEVVDEHDYFNVNSNNGGLSQSISLPMPSASNILLPSENTAFCDDIPQRMTRVVSEPILPSFEPIIKWPPTFVIRHSLDQECPQWSAATSVPTMEVLPSCQFRPISTPLSMDSEPDASVVNSAVPSAVNVDSSMSLRFLVDNEAHLETGSVYQQYVASSTSDDELAAGKCLHDCPRTFHPRFKVRCGFEKAAQTVESSMKSEDANPQNIVQEILLEVDREFNDDCHNRSYIGNFTIGDGQLSVGACVINESSLVPCRLSQIWNSSDELSGKFSSGSTPATRCKGPDAAPVCDLAASPHHDFQKTTSVTILESTLSDASARCEFAMFPDTSKAIWRPVVKDQVNVSAGNAATSGSLANKVPASVDTLPEKAELVEMTNKFESLGLCGKIWSNDEFLVEQLPSQCDAGGCAVSISDCDASLKAIWNKPDDSAVKPEKQLIENQLSNVVSGIEGLFTLGMLIGPVEQRSSCVTGSGHWPATTLESELLGFSAGGSIDSQSNTSQNGTQSTAVVECDACRSGACGNASGMSMVSTCTDTARNKSDQLPQASLHSSSGHSYLWYPLPIASGNADISLCSVLNSSPASSRMFSSLPVGVASSASSGEMNHEEVLNLIKQLSPVVDTASKHIGESFCKLATNSRTVDLWI